MLTSFLLFDNDGNCAVAGQASMLGVAEGLTA
jgi:hypothetical protein